MSHRNHPANSFGYAASRTARERGGYVDDLSFAQNGMAVQLTAHHPRKMQKTAVGSMPLSAMPAHTSLFEPYRD